MLAMEEQTSRLMVMSHSSVRMRAISALNISCMFYLCMATVDMFQEQLQQLWEETGIRRESPLCTVYCQLGS